MKINTDPMNMDALDFDDVMSDPVVNRGMNFVHASRHC